MTERLNKTLVERLTFVEQKAQETLASRYKDKYGNDHISDAIFIGFRSATLSFLKSTFGETNVYYSEFLNRTKFEGYKHLLNAIEILKSLRFEIEHNWLNSLKGLVSAEIFTDFIDMAEHLLENGFKDAAAVIIGSVLEEQLRQLATKNGIDITFEKKGDLISKKADRLNADLASASIYNKLDQKNVTAWLDLRNKAAHGKYDEYNIAQVKIMQTSVTDFISRNQI